VSFTLIFYFYAFLSIARCLLEWVGDLLNLNFNCPKRDKKRSTKWSNNNTDGLNLVQLSAGRASNKKNLTNYVFLLLDLMTIRSVGRMPMVPSAKGIHIDVII
jgi:hypothetical protein